MRCFLLEPVYGEPGSLKTHSPEHYRKWNPELREILKFRNTTTGEERDRIQDFGIGAMWFAPWYGRNLFWDNENEPHLLVTTPGGDWDLDSRCSNCTRPDDRTHRCWVRHGTPPDITVDKNGDTCAAGAGSFAPKNGQWHGFLWNGHLVTA